MNNRTAIGLVAAVIIIGILIFAFGSRVPKTVQIPLGEMPAPTGAATGTPAATASGTPAAPSSVSRTPSFTQVAETKTVIKNVARLDESSLTTSSKHPVITGIANVSAVGIVVDDPSGVGIVGSDNIPVENGHWSYAVPRALTPGVYTVHLIGGDTTVEGKLTVTS